MLFLKPLQKGKRLCVTQCRVVSLLYSMRTQFSNHGYHCSFWASLALSCYNDLNLFPTGAFQLLILDKSQNLVLLRSRSHQQFHLAIKRRSIVGIVSVLQGLCILIASISERNWPVKIKMKSEWNRPRLLMTPTKLSKLICEHEMCNKEK